MDRAKLLSDVGCVLYKLRMGHPDKLTQGDVANELHMDKATYSRSENGLRDITIGELFMYAEFYGIPPTTILENIQQTPADLAKIKQLQLQLDELTKENRFLKDQIEAEIRKQA